MKGHQTKDEGERLPERGPAPGPRKDFLQVHKPRNLKEMLVRKLNTNGLVHPEALDILAEDAMEVFDLWFQDLIHQRAMGLDLKAQVTMGEMREELNRCRTRDKE